MNDMVKSISILILLYLMLIRQEDICTEKRILADFSFYLYEGNTCAANMSNLRKKR